jgi:DNA integrity scanning protein DisA with diadenylate cyclase activity
MDKTVESMCTVGIVLDVEFTATRLRELCKLHGVEPVYEEDDE